MNSLRKNLAAVVATVGLMGWSGTASAQDVMRIAQLALPAVVMLVVFDKYEEPVSQGSGFVIGEGLIVTNAHMVEGIHYAAVAFVGGMDFFEVEAVLGLDQKNDLAILSVPGIAGNDALRLGQSGSVQIGQPIVAVGTQLASKEQFPTASSAHSASSMATECFRFLRPSPRAAAAGQS